MAKVNARLAESPEDGGLWFQRAFLNLEHEDVAQALADLEKAEALAPGKLPTLFLKGRALEMTGNFIEARTALDAQILRFPEDGRSYAARAQVLEKLELAELSLADYRTALAKTADANPDLLQPAAVAMAKYGHREEALEILETGIKRLGGIPSLVSKAIEIELDAGQFDSALARVVRAEKSALRPEPWMVQRAEVLARAGRVRESRAAWQSLISHLIALPEPERESHAMLLILQHAQEALRVLNAVPTMPSQQNPFTRSNL